MLELNYWVYDCIVSYLEFININKRIPSENMGILKIITTKISIDI